MVLKLTDDAKAAITDDSTANDKESNNATIKVNIKDNVSKIFSIMQTGGGTIVTNNKVVDEPGEVSFYKLDVKHH